VPLVDWFLPQFYQRGDDPRLDPPGTSVAVAAAPAAQPADSAAFDFFLSHNHASKPRVEKIAVALRERGLRAWYDAWNVGREPIQVAVEKGIAASRFVMICCTRKALESDWVEAERQMAYAKDVLGRNILPVLLEDVADRLLLGLKTVDQGQLEWRDPAPSTLHRILRHPRYVGAYAYGRSLVDPRRKIPGRPGTGQTRLPMDRWRVLLHDVFPAYITWQQYLANQERLKQNASQFETLGAPREGPTLLGGLVTCADQAEESAPPRQHALRPLHILLVEDHGVTAKMMRMMLTAEGHSVESAGDVATAMQLANQHAFDLLVSDLGLPDGSGHDLMRELREHGYKFPGIALSGYGQEDDIQRSRKAGFAAHLTKPASREAVIEAVAAATAGQPATNATGPTSGADTTARVNAAVFDVDSALKRCFGKPAFLKNMASHFLTESPAMLGQVREALDRQDAAEVAATVHRLAGTLGYLGEPEALAAAQEVVKIGKSGDLSPAAEAIARLEQKVAGLRDAVSKWSQVSQ
jgi:CheY-like chemotaxis protein/HPt (histidine-containing phosphotransfer) domain-containing protein